MRQRGRKGKGDEELGRPNGIRINREDVVYVAEHGNNWVSLFKCDGAPVRPPFGSRGSELGQFNGPYRIALDKEENIYAADLCNNCIQKLRLV